MRHEHRLILAAKSFSHLLLLLGFFLGLTIPVFRSLVFEFLSLVISVALFRLRHLILAAPVAMPRLRLWLGQLPYPGHKNTKACLGRPIASWRLRLRRWGV